MTSKEGREEALKRVSQCILQDRNASYGDPEDNFREIASLWTTTTGIVYDVASVSILMIQMKMTRIKGNPGHLDSWIDIAGYALCQAGMLIRDDALIKTTAPSSAPQGLAVASSDVSLQIAQTEQELRRLAQAFVSLKEIERNQKTP